jgi:hypothetical protein
MADKMTFEILEDGTITIETDAVSGKNHKNADEFLSAIEKLAGGPRSTKRKGKLHTHGQGVSHCH